MKSASLLHVRTWFRCSRIRKNAGSRHRTRILATAATIIGCLLPMAGCGQKTEKSSAKVYDIKGKIVAIRPDREGVTLDHEDIPGLMKGMKMQFLVEDARILEGLEVGDQVQGKLKIESGSQLITELKKR